MEEYEEEWRSVTLPEIGEVNRGRSRHRPRYAEHLYGGPYPFIQTGDVKASNGRISKFSQTYSEAGLKQSRLWPAGTMCITIAANIAETGILGFDACFPDSVVGFIADPQQANSAFIQYLFQTLKPDIQHRASGSVQDNINLETLAKLRFEIPNMQTQRAIAEVLGALDDKIAANTKLAELLNQIAETTYDKARATADTSRLLSDVVSTQYGLTTSAHKDPGPKFLRVTDINKKPWIEWETTPNCTVSADELAKYRVEPGDILVARMADPGKAALVDDGHQEAVFASYLVRLRANNPAVAKYIYYFLRSREYQDYAAGAMQGSVQKNMNAKVIVATQIAMPSASVVEDFERDVSAIRLRICSALEENRTLAATRDTLLPQLMSGKLRVKDIENTMGEMV